MVSKLKLFNVLLPGVSVMDRYIFIQLLLPFLFGVGAFSSIATSIGSVFELIRQVTQFGLPLEIAVKVLLLTMPEFIVYSFPMSMLLSTMMTFSRLSGDSEIIALRSSGVSVYRLIVPAIILSMMVTGLTFFLQESLVPAAKIEAAATMEKALKQDKPAFKQDNIIYPDYAEETNADGKKTRNLVRLFYARQFDGRQMTDVMVVDRSRNDISQIINAKSGQLDLAKKPGTLPTAPSTLLIPSLPTPPKASLNTSMSIWAKHPWRLPHPIASPMK